MPPAGLSAASAVELVISAVSAAVAVTTRQDYTDYNRLHLYSIADSRFFSWDDHCTPTLCPHRRATRAGVRARPVLVNRKGRG